MVSPLVSGIYEATQAAKQKKQGEQLRNDAKFIQKEALRPEMNQKLSIEQALALAGLPGFANIKNNIEQNVAGNIGNIKQLGTGGAEKLAALTAAINKGTGTLADLGVEDATFRTKAKGQVANTLGDIAQQQRNLELERTRKVENQLRAASAMENASTQNMDNAIKTIGGGASNAITGTINNAITSDNNNSAFNMYNAYLKALLSGGAGQSLGGG